MTGIHQMNVDITPALISAGFVATGRHFITLKPVVDQYGPKKMLILHQVIVDEKVTTTTEVGVVNKQGVTIKDEYNGAVKDIVSQAVFELIQNTAMPGKDPTRQYKQI
jgi:hypothetical protein